ncbi:MAG: DUF4349 domain-containing protein [Bacteroidetes bacterium]|nr:DUF4349 domain-containing protein [Bacteroidota bacterium]
MKRNLLTNPLKNLNPGKKIVFLFALSFIFLASCNDSSSGFGYGKAKEESLVSASMDMSEPPPPPMTEKVAFTPAGSGETEDSKEAGNASVPPADAPAVKIAEKIKKTADVDISVEDYKIAREAIGKIVKAGNAYIGGENEQNSTYSITNSMVIRVANKDFDGMVTNLAAVASNVNSKNVYMEDVTAEFVDITARLKTKKEVEKRYIELLNKATKVTDILEVEQQLRVIREEIEAKEGQLKYLNDQVNYSTINLTLHQNFEYTPQNEPGFFGRMGHAFGNGWKGFLSFLVGIVYAWPLWIILGMIAYFSVKFIKKRLKK